MKEADTDSSTESMYSIASKASSNNKNDSYLHASMMPVDNPENSFKNIRVPHELITHGRTINNAGNKYDFNEMIYDDSRDEGYVPPPTKR
jgi:hypothetical protein